MRIDFDTADLSRHDALSLAVLIHSRFPDVMGQVSLMANASFLAMAAAGAGALPPEHEELSAEDAFAGGPPAVVPAAGEAFAGPQPDGALLDTGQAGGGLSTSATAGDGAATSTTATNDASRSDGPAVDSSGLPWDARIHSGGGATIGDGTWKKKKGVGADMVKAVQEELRARMAAGPLAGTTPAAPPPPENAAPTSSTTSTSPAAPAAPVAATAPPPPAAHVEPAPPAPPAPAPTTTPGPADAPATFPPEVAAQALQAAAQGTGAFAEGQAPAVVFATVMRKVTDGAFTADELGAACAAVGLMSPRELLKSIHLCADFAATLDDLAAARPPAA